VPGANGIVGAGLSIAAAAAFAHHLAGDGGVVLAFFGDGAQATGAFHESVSLAAVWRLPVAFFCENNHYAEFSPEVATVHAESYEMSPVHSRITLLPCYRNYPEELEWRHLALPSEGRVAT